MSGQFPEKWSDWMETQIWPQIWTMMTNDAIYRLMCHARELTGEFNGPIAELIRFGYVTSQTIGIRKLCDDRKDVISLRRLLIEVGGKCLFATGACGELSSKLDCCEPVCKLVNDYVAHTANPSRRPSFSEWDLRVGQIVGAQRAICEVAVALDRDVLQQSNPVTIIPVHQDDVMKEFRPWVSEDDIDKLWEFWHEHNDQVNSWVTFRLASFPVG